MFWQHKKYTHISQNTIESIYIDLHERQMTQEVYMYILKFGKIHIYMKWKHMIINQIQKWEYKFKNVCIIKTKQYKHISWVQISIQAQMK